jgi:hypothetical protein
MIGVEMIDPVPKINIYNSKASISLVMNIHNLWDNKKIHLNKSWSNFSFNVSYSFTKELVKLC